MTLRDSFPPLSSELIAALETVFPDRCPDASTPDRQVWIDAGAAGVVRFLRHKLEEQNENHLQDD